MTAQTLTWSNRVNEAVRAIPNWAVYLAGALPGLYIVIGIALALTGTFDLFGGRLGVDPTRTIEHWTGELALQFFIATMLISVLQKFFRLKLIKFRRPLGLLTFYYVLLHLLVWVGLDLQFRWSEVWTDIVKRPYITIGMAAFMLMLPVAMSSNNAAIKKLGPGIWKRLHKLVYPAFLLGAIHYVMVQKVWETEPLIYLAIIIVLLALRGRRLLPWR